MIFELCVLHHGAGNLEILPEDVLREIKKWYLCGVLKIYDICKLGLLDVLKCYHNEKNTHVLGSYICIAAEYGHLEIVKYLFEKCRTAGNSRLTPILPAIKHGHIDIVRYLVENGQDVNNVWNPYRLLRQHQPVWANGPIKFAARFGQYQIIKYLIENGATYNRKDIQNGALYDYLETVRYIVKQSGIESVG